MDGADVVIVHEWTDPAIVARLGAMRRAGAPWLLLFHDTHHRAVSEPGGDAGLRPVRLRRRAGVRRDAGGGVSRLGLGGPRVRVARGGGHRAVPPARPRRGRGGAVWIGNWGDGERTAELEAFLLAPLHRAGIPLDIHGVRYPPEALAMLERYGARYHGWLPNHAAPAEPSPATPSPCTCRGGST